MRSSLVRSAAVAAVLAVTSSAMPLSTAAAGEPWIIGAVLSENGPGATLGRPEADSMQLAVDEINKSGGLFGRQVQLTILDDNSDATTAINDVKQLIDKHPIAIFGTPLTPTSLAIVPLTEKAQIPLISFASSSSVVTPVDQHHWTFKVPINDTEVALSMQAYLKKKGQTRVSFIYRDDDYGKTGMAHFGDAGKAQGFETISNDAIAPAATDATTQLTHVKAANPQAIIAWTTLPSAGVIIKDYRELSLTTPLYYSDGAATGVFPKQAGKALDGAFIATMKVNVADQLSRRDPTKPLLDAYIASFERDYPKDSPVSIFGTWGYDGIGFFKAAMLKAGPDATTVKLRDAMEHTSFTGVSGTFHFSPEHHYGLSESDVVVAQIRDQKFVIAR
jgi:branched-chain amino acid transport system substrate-binding protein